MYFGHNSILVMDRAVVDRGGWCGQFCLSISQNLSQHIRISVHPPKLFQGFLRLGQASVYYYNGCNEIFLVCTKKVAIELYLKEKNFCLKVLMVWVVEAAQSAPVRTQRGSQKLQMQKDGGGGIFFLPLFDFLILSSGGPKFPLRCVGTVGRRYLCRTIYIFY